MSILMTMAAAAAMAGSSGAAAQGVKPTIVVVHGAFNDAAPWKGTAAALEKDGYHTIVIDLPGRPSNPMAADKVSVELYRDTVLARIKNERRPVVLVGHSFGGVTIAAVAEKAPEKVKTLVFLAAYLPKDGDSAISLASVDRDSKAGPNIKPDMATGMAVIEPTLGGQLFASDASAAVQEAVSHAIIQEPVGPMNEKVHLTNRFADVDKVYIHTAQDQVVSPYLQTVMTNATPVRLSITIASGHAPFVTDVPELVAAIEQAAR